MNVTAPSALRPLPLGALPSADQPAADATRVMASDRYEATPAPAAAPTVKAQGGFLGWIGGIFGSLFGIFNPGYPCEPYPSYPNYPCYPSNPGGYIPPETNYGPVMMGILGRYDQQQAQLGWQRRGMSNSAYAYYERNLWMSTCDQIVSSWASREEKLAALGHVLNSSSMQYGDFERYAARVGGVHRGW